MIGSNKRGIRRTATRVRLAVAAAVLVGGGAAGVAAVAASHSGAMTAQSAGYTRQALSEPKALSSAMNGWSKSPGRSLTTLSEMTPMRTFNMTAWHHAILAVQRGTVVAAAKKEFVVKSSNHTLAAVAPVPQYEVPERRRQQGRDGRHDRRHHGGARAHEREGEGPRQR